MSVRAPSDVHLHGNTFMERPISGAASILSETGCGFRGTAAGNSAACVQSDDASFVLPLCLEVDEPKSIVCTDSSWSSISTDTPFSL